MSLESVEVDHSPVAEAHICWGPQIRMDGLEDRKRSRKSRDPGSEMDLESVDG